MRLMFLPVTMLLSCSGLAHAHDHNDGSADTSRPGFAIANPLRPGAKAPDCSTFAETPDGCTFHVSNGEILYAHLPLGPDVVWIAVASVPDLIKVSPAVSTENLPSRQTFVIGPKIVADKDLTITFDKIVGYGETRKVVERRRVSLMLH